MQEDIGVIGWRCVGGKPGGWKLETGNWKLGTRNEQRGTRNQEPTTQPLNQSPGSIFHFTALFGKAEEKEVGTFVPVSLSDKKALLVDDNRTNLDILTRNLESAGMSAVAFTKGEEVVTALKSALADGNPFDCCILDIQMPGMSGYDVAKQIRNFKAPIKSIPLLALSSLMERDSKKCEEAGFNGFLNKPIRREKLYKMLERLLGMGNLDCGLQSYLFEFVLSSPCY